MRTSLMALAPVVAGGAALGDLFVRGRARLQLSRAKHPSLSGHARWSRRIAGLIPFYEYGDGEFFRSDDAPEAVVQQRRDGFARLSQLYRDRYPRTVAMTRRSSEIISDLQFTASYRVPFQFSRRVRDELATGSFLQSAQGTTVTDLDGNVFYDLTGSYGVNLFGHDFYKQCMQAGIERTRDLGVSLGAYHPVVAENVTRLRTISGLDEVSFHMSGTEAVMQAVRLARYHTRRPKLVRFCGAYHGWWGEVQPGVGNPTPADRTLTLAEMSQRTLAVLRRRRDIACVLVNPLQALRPNGSAPSDSTLVAGGRQAAFDREAYAAWLRELRSVCDARGIVLIFDEVFVGFRLAPHGAREYFGVQPDMITYGKTLGGGLPVGVLCGGHRLMRRFRDDRPADICFARGTFNAHPQVMGAMHEFLRRIEEPDIRALYEGLDQLWDNRAASLNARLASTGLPVRVANMSSIWTVLYTSPSRYHWMLQYYLRAQGLALSWVGTGRLIFSLDYTDGDFGAVADCFVAACVAMRQDGWWWVPAGAGSKAMQRRVLSELLSARLGRRGRNSD
ncbi:aminotransferase class III-fold pyridoxal phosphate-dependent enzyme [Lichenicoccus roseus]|uniref:Aminotransferase class III-fold pyridoxal phosphate-dependent enzyme n=1 Tax=Lichenicoccus roseus TaxID=2683649 RepID=A0A5R9J5X5_9PROT|nr:aminotransferase class III-fold pyridoxal phosphate-dependent enzyme [Lichenicoccus roseus]TLU72962.1 aminotransferase class III-fold pyridoxal phosphate-dependent enzyme [Lichenicoccus roseus]